MDIIRFSKDFEKLKKDIFQTIEDKDKGLKLGRTVIISSPNCKFEAEVVGMQKVTLSSLSLDFLLNDLGLRPAREYSKAQLEVSVLKKFQKFYPNLQWSDTVYVYTFHAKKNRGE